MKIHSRVILSLFLGFVALPAAAATLYVDANGTNPVSPYNSWSTAATNIQDALNVFTAPGSLVLVTNGIYQYSGFSNSGSNRAYANNDQTIQSVNGPQYTIIEGYQVPGTTNGSSAVRCVYLQKGCSLYGFTLTNGATASFAYGGGVYCGAPDCVVSNCILIGNAAYDGGGGCYSGTLINCQVIGNAVNSPNVGSGGGAYQSTLISCLLTANGAGYRGAAAENSTLINCTVVTNVGQVDGVDDCKLLNCISYYNYPDNGESSGDGTSFSNCCVAVLPTFNSANNFTNAPLFVNLAGGDYHLSPGSPCINAGNNSYITNTTDLDGNPRIVNGTVDLGAYESPYNNLKNVHFVSLASTNPISPFNDWSIAATNIQDAIDASTNGDSVIVTDGVYQVGARVVFGSMTNRVVINKAITVESVNGPAATTIAGLPFTAPAVGYRCVYLTNGATLSGFTLTNGATRQSGDLTNEQSGGAVWCASASAVISNCVLIYNYAWNYAGAGYQGTFKNCIISNNTAFLYGGGTYLANLNNCVITSNRLVQGFGGGGTAYGTLSNCLVTWNSAPNGGGSYYSTLNNCVVSNNFAGSIGGGGLFECIANNSLISSNYTRGFGGGACSNTLYNCLVENNFALENGGGAYKSALYNCTVVSNTSAISGGGAQNCEFTNSIIYYNKGGSGPNAQDCVLFYSDSFTPGSPPPPGFGNISNAPVFVNLAGGDYHLQSNSPCINSGNNAYVTSTSDLDDNPRITGGTVDMGAYEYQTPASIISYAWLQQYGLPADGSVDFTDLDGTGFNVYQDWIAGLNPTNSASVLAMQSPASTNNASGITVTWQSVTNILYNLQRSSDLTASFLTIQSNIVGHAGTTSYTDTAATNNLPYFYRVGVP